jgi:hypothetical protein
LAAVRGRRLAPIRRRQKLYESCAVVGFIAPTPRG